MLHSRAKGGDVLSVALSLRLPDDIKKYVQEQAQENRTSMGHYIVMLIDKDMKENESKNREKKQGIRS